MFQLNESQGVRLAEWNHEQDAIVAERQKGTEFGKLGRPYYGAIGGSLTYSFTPTSLGLVVKVTHAGTKAEIDLSDYHDW